MNIHKNARLTRHSRADLVRRVEAGQPIAAVAAAFGVSIRTVRKWVERFNAEGIEGLRDRSSRPHRLYRPTPETVVGRSGAAAPAALDRQADRGRTRHLAGHRQPHPQAPRPEPHQRAGAGRAGAPLRARSIPASSSTSTSRSSAASTGSAIASPATDGPEQHAAASAGSSSMSPSTTPRAWPSRRSCPTRRRRAPSPSCVPPSPTTQASASPWPAS